MCAGARDSSFVLSVRHDAAEQDGTRESQIAHGSSLTEVTDKPRKASRVSEL